MATELSFEGDSGGSPLIGQARETSGATSVLLLAYLDRVGGASVISEVLARCGLSECEEELRDENAWFSWQTKIDLFEATADVLGKPDFLEEMAELALEAGVGGGVRVALRTLGSPQVVYRSVVRANARFNGSHAMELVSLGRGEACTRFADISGQRRFHPLDCQYSAAMLRLVPQLFGLPKAQLRHRKCMGHGDEACVYEVRWREHVSTGRRALAAASTTAGALGTSLLFIPAALPAAVALAVSAAGGLAVSELRRHRKAWQTLQSEATDHAEVAQRLFATLEDLVSDLRLEEVLTKVTRNAQAAVGGREFALLVRDGDTLTCQSSSGLPAGTVKALERWANQSAGVTNRSLVLDEVRDVPALAALADEAMPLCSLASSPLTFHGETLGVLIALGTQSHTFLPRDVEVLQSFASQASIAMHNARRYHVTKTQADVDGLTGLLNHRSFHEALDHALAADIEGCVVLVDLDNFKRINDGDGHGAGDCVLTAAAAALSDACRGEDLAFRIGGDEFAILLPGLDARAAEAVAARVCAAIAALDPRLGASAGVAAITRGAGKDAVLKEADGLLYAAKRGEHAGYHRSAASSTGAARVAVEMLAAALELHDPATAAHSAAVAELSRRVAARLGAGAAECEFVQHVGLVHDAGKLALDPELLAKPGRLDPSEFQLVRTHPDHGADLLMRVPGLEDLSGAVRASHERWDGLGYPAGLIGDQIPLPARIVAACDAFETMVTDKPYAPRRPYSAAIVELERCAGSRFDPLVVRALVSELTAELHHTRAAAA